MSFVGGRAEAQASPESVARDLQNRYGRIESLRAQFVQTVGQQKLRGTLSVRDAAFRLDLGEQVLVTDGQTMWSYSEPDDQVVVQAYDPARVGFSVGQLFTDYLSVFRATGATRARIGGVPHTVLTLRPRRVGLDRPRRDALRPQLGRRADARPRPRHVGEHARVRPPGRAAEREPAGLDVPVPGPAWDGGGRFAVSRRDGGRALRALGTEG